MREIVKTDETGRRISEFVSGRGSKGMFKQVFGMFIAPPLFQEGGFVNGVEKFPRVMPT